MMATIPAYILGRYCITYAVIKLSYGSNILPDCGQRMAHENL